MPSLKTLLSILLLIIGLLIVAWGLRAPNYNSAYDVATFSRLPALEGGRIKPLDSVARNALLVIHGKQTVRDQTVPEGLKGSEKRTFERTHKRKAIEWFMELTLRPERAALYPLFRIYHPEVLAIFGKREGEQKYVSFMELHPHLVEIDRQYQAFPKDEADYDAYQKALAQLYRTASLYLSLAHTLQPSMNFQGSVEGDYQAFLQAAGSAHRIVKEQKNDFDPSNEQWLRFMAFVERYRQGSEAASVHVIAPQTPDASWKKVGEALIGDDIVASFSQEAIDPIALGYARLADAYRAGDSELFNTTVASITKEVEERTFGVSRDTVNFEAFFNAFAPFYRAALVLLLAFIVICTAWLLRQNHLLRAAWWMGLIGCCVLTFGVIARVYIQGRPPVTNLYSSAVFVGWATVVFGLVLERIYRNGVSAAAAMSIGFGALIIAHHLSLSGDTLEMMVAVLDSNFWLATHVPTVTLGYAATFLAGGLGIFYILRNLFGTIDAKTNRILASMVYGTVCFALLFSFVGTMLGGIWADQSWGRFWGWDPKENGALLIVLWNAAILHARLGGLVQTPGIMNMAVFGNIVTAWSWFGTNMLGEGLHSYGFMDSAFLALMLFCFSQLLLITIHLIIQCLKGRALAK